MKGLIVLAIALSAQVASASVLKEVWTCKGADNNVVSTIKVSIDNKTNTSSGVLKDGTMTSADIKIAAESDTYHLGGYVAPGHDNREYTVQLVPFRAEDFEYGSETKLKGRASVFYSGFIDCVGDVSDVEVLSCEIEVTR
ncbi:MAG: hypothetical protein K2Q18_04780 [Bdellovibrionales bacterium]|nr:hypothetical protein [Bdellovibrionales bacterium]